MTRVLLDACVPQWLRRELGAIDVVTARYAGLDQLSDGALLNAMTGQFDVLVTLDRSLSYHNRVAGRTFAIIVMRVADQSPALFRALVPELIKAIAAAIPGTVTYVGT